MARYPLCGHVVPSSTFYLPSRSGGVESGHLVCLGPGLPRAFKLTTKTSSQRSASVEVHFRNGLLMICSAPSQGRASQLGRK